MTVSFKDCKPFTPRVLIGALPEGIAQFGSKLRAIAKAASNGRMVVHPNTSLQYFLTGDDDIVAAETLALTLPGDDEPLVYVIFLDGSPTGHFTAKIFGRWTTLPFHMIDLYTATESRPEGWEAWAESNLAQIKTDERQEEYNFLCDIYNDTEHYDFSDEAWDRRRALGYALGEY